MAKHIDGKALALKIRQELAQEVQKGLEKGWRAPGLHVVLVGEDPASQVYVRNKERAAEKAGFKGQVHRLSAKSTREEVKGLIHQLASDGNVDGILVQLPLPDHLDDQEILDWIPPEKDVDGFHPVNLGLLVRGEDAHVPCTPLGIMKMLEYENIDLKGKEVVVLGRSNIVGKPMALLVMQKKKGANATVTLCHSGTQNLAEHCQRADVLIAALGQAQFVTQDMVKEGAIVIDVGINRLEDGSLCGDVHFDEVESKASSITPVPGGVGPMTIAMLLSNTLDAWQKKLNA